ncbi:hypothetical protein DM02DRAFT_616421 [Periconia macrospinosa]|uniref:Restriction of telomere capping protein 5 n=1 Tax=Periconia macrospinosa TaxID=97972 RepID=A0A2V1DJ37_9PLEO|nr:hypothetical protein DM02DRAFT_616421 [Periconia macrospinosa]
MSVEEGKEEREREKEREIGGGGKGFAIDAPEEGDEEDEEDDELVLAALDSMDAADVFKHGEQSDVHHSIIPTDNLLKLVELLLLIAPIDPQESVSSFVGKLTDERVDDLRRTANSILSSFSVEKNPGVDYRTFNAVVPTCLPYLFDGLNPLFEHFLFAKDLDLSKKRHRSSSSTTSPPSPKAPTHAPPRRTSLPPNPEPILRPGGEILDLPTLNQLSFFLKGTTLFRRLRPLYSGNTHGFSMGAFQKQVFNWRAPTILLVSGRLLPSMPSSTRERALADTLPPQRHPSSISPSSSPSSSTSTSTPQNKTLTYGAYIPTQWKPTPKTCFSTQETTLFQLSPTHDVFRGSNYVSDYAYFCKPPSSSPPNTGIGFGTPLPSSSSSHHHHTSSTSPLLRLGPVSLHLDDALEFAVFTHEGATSTGGGSSFSTSPLPSRRGKSWQDRFEIDALEVWGCGGDDVAEAQRREWAFEEREAEARRRVNLGTGDVDADRELLRMAGLVGGEGRSGGSV